ncbi:MAG: trigger factor [Rickettsiales bacterium]|jgi:trigger factor|nr:trigger factor [Rickettsiales bacterium]
MGAEKITKNYKLDLTTANRDGTTIAYQATVNPLSSEELIKTFSATVPTEALNAIKDFKLRFVAKSKNLKGFRPGKAPLNVIWNQHQGEILNEMANDLINETTQGIVNELNVDLVTSPKIDLKHFDLEKGLEFEVTLHLSPEFDLPEVKDISLEKLTYEIKDSDIKDRVKTLLDRHKTYVKAKDTYKAANGDKVVIDFEGKIDNVVFPGGTAKGHTLELGTKSFIDNFEDQLLKHKAGDEVLVTVTFPKDYHQKDFAGKKAEFSVTIHEVLQAKTCDNEEEFAKDVGFASVDEMNAKVKEALTKECNEKNHVQMKIALFDKLDKICNFTLPQMMVDQEFSQLWKNVEGMIERKETDKTEKELKEEYQKLAKRRVKLGLLLSAMAKKYDVKVEQNDLVEAVRGQAMGNPAAAQQIIKYYTENKDAVESLKGPIIEEKVVQNIFKEIKTTDKAITVKKLLEPAQD